jgi:transcriptional regulator with XRE-family HTH domain
MQSKSDPLKDIEFFQLVKANQYKTPNEFTQGMGELIRLAREERGMSQVDLAKEINRRPATISLIENGKSEISVLTLMLFAIALQKPISYFFPASLLKDWIVDIKTPFEQKGLELLRNIEFFGDAKFTLDLLKLLLNHFEEEYEAASRGYPEEPEDLS